jgi:hypothetical protein
VTDERADLPVLVRFRKDQPSDSDVHVDVPLGVELVRRKRKKKADDEPNEDESDVGAEILKTDDEQRIVYGIVLEPDVEDSQGDVVSRDDVELAAHRFLYQQGLAIGDQHRSLAPSEVRPVESYIAPADFEMGGQTVKKGSWVLAVHVADDDLWQQVKKDQKAAFSVGGTGKRAPLDDVVAKENAPAVGSPPLHVHVNFHPGAIAIPEQQAPIVLNNVHVEHPKPKTVRVETDEDGSKRYVPE